MNGSCLLISGGEYADIPEDIKNADFVIACDRGWQHAEKMQIRPGLIMGDFDSAPAPDTTVPVMRFPSHKDDTDTMIAAREALKRGFKDIYICCAFGARLDHTMANIQTAAFLVSNGASVRLYGKDTVAYVFTDSSVILPVKSGYSLSLFSLTDKCEGVCIEGTEYECDDVTVTNTFPIGVSNEWASGEAHISVRSGILMVLCSAL